MPIRLTSLLALYFLFTGPICHAEERNFFWDLAYHKGRNSDQIPTEEMAPDNYSSVSAGSGLSASLGWTWRLSQNFSISPSLGYKENSNSLDILKAELVEWKILFLNLPALYRINNWQIGAGFTYHYKPTLKASDKEDNYSEEWEFDDSIGSIFKLDYFYDGEDAIGLQYTKIDYTYGDMKPVSGDNIALVLRVMFSL